MKYLSDNNITLVLTEGQLSKELLPIFDEYRISLLSVSITTRSVSLVQHNPPKEILQGGHIALRLGHIAILR